MLTNTAEVNLIDYSNRSVNKFSRPPNYQYFLIKNKRPYKMPRGKIIFFLTLHLIVLGIFNLLYFTKSKSTKLFMEYFDRDSNF